MRNSEDHSVPFCSASDIESAILDMEYAETERIIVELAVARLDEDDMAREYFLFSDEADLYEQDMSTNEGDYQLYELGIISFERLVGGYDNL